jgi:hypothetical protein
MMHRFLSRIAALASARISVVLPAPPFRLITATTFMSSFAICFASMLVV